MKLAQLSRQRREAFGSRADLASVDGLVRLAPNKASRMGRAFQALSNATRRAILRELIVADAPAYHLALRFEVGLPSIYKHLRVLRSAGLVVENLRGREKWYSIDQPTVEQARAYLTALAANDSTASEHVERG